jgi:hypothetical protein
MRRQPLQALQLPVPRTFDLTHVEPAHFASAMGNDPARMFEFVRDQIAYEAYVGVLRGARGTLMARAGNSLDRAMLLAALFQAGGHRVRFARGSLADAEARALVTTMWATRPLPSIPEPEGDRPESLDKVVQGLLPAVNRDADLIVEQLKKAASPGNLDLGPSLEALAKETRNHYWVQWQNEGKWVDLDTSFTDATLGRRFTEPREVSEALAADLFHRVTIRLIVEESSGPNSSIRQILTFSAKAADLSGRDVVLAHFPENWNGPVSSLEDALSSAMQDTGRIKPVLLIESEVVTGELFRQKPPAGLGGLTDMLSGEGTRKPLELATAETLEIDFIAPDGRKDTVKREIFDVIGKARRRMGGALTAEDLRARAQSAADITGNVYSLFFTTGRIDPEHLLYVSAERPAIDEPIDLLLVLRRFNVIHTALSDAFIPRLGRPEEGVVIFYQDSPRVSIVELASQEGVNRLVLDLRRDYARAAVMGPRPEAILGARMLRGVLNGTLEKAFMEYVTIRLREGDDSWRSRVSTSAVFDWLAEQRVQALLLPKEIEKLVGVADNSLARLKEEGEEGYLLIVPQRSMSIDGQPRIAWWRVEPRSGATVAVTDEGLHAVTVEYQVQQNRATGQTRMAYRQVIDGRAGPWNHTEWVNQGSSAWDTIFRDFARNMQGAISLGIRYVRFIR